MAHTTSFAPRATVDLSELARAVMDSLRTVRAARHARRRMRRELETYTGRELADLGLSHADIPEVVAGRFRR